MRAQKVEINNRQIQLVYSDEYNNNQIKEFEHSTIIKNDNEKSGEKTRNLNINKLPEKINIKIENNGKEENKYNNNIRTNNFQIDNNYNSKNIESPKKMSIIKSEDEKKKLIIEQNNQISKKKEKESQNQKKISKAYNRFKKALSLHKDKENEKNIGNSDKILSLASILQGHIKPLDEIQGENDGKKYRGASVECNETKFSENHIIKLLESMPVTKKNIKKPKFTNFA